jgi:Icc-related predicted phosphoesterase
MRSLWQCSWILVPALILTTAPAQAGKKAPATWQELTEAAAFRYGCPGSFVKLQQPDAISIGKLKVERLGSQWTISGETHTPGSLTIGVLGAIKDAGRDTKGNLKLFAKWFKKQKIDIIVANGDIALDEFDLEEVFIELGRLGYPVLVIAGNSESRTSFNRTAVEVARKHPNIINGNWVRRLDWGAYSLWTVPGYHDKKFLYGRNGCLYKRDHIRATARAIGKAKKQVNVLIAHGPPRYKGAPGLDKITDGKHVGDKMLSKLIKDLGIKFGIFGHILEAGGTVATKMGDKASAAGSAQKSLYFNAGSANGLPWGMNDGQTMRGMAAVLKLDGKTGTVLFKKIK